MGYVWYAVIEGIVALATVVALIFYFRRGIAGMQPKRTYPRELDEREAQADIIRSLRSDLDKAYAVIKMREAQAAPIVGGAIKAQSVTANVSTPELEVLRQISIGVDVLAMEQQKFRKGFDNWVRVNFGNNSGGYQDMTDDEASLREEAATLMRRYGMSYEDAMTRAKLAATYKGNGMGGAA